jgi:hypothetical protein
VIYGGRQDRVLPYVLRSAPPVQEYVSGRPEFLGGVLGGGDEPPRTGTGTVGLAVQVQVDELVQGPELHGSGRSQHQSVLGRTSTKLKER